MLVFALFSWWYTAGWAQLSRRVRRAVIEALDLFSVGLLLRSLFAPFRQISVGRVQGPLDVQLRAWADRQISRGIGAMVRLAVILFGLVVTMVLSVAALALLVVWPLVPIMPVLVVVVTLGVL